MAYGLRYYSEYKTLIGNNTERIEIEERNYSGTSEEITLSGSPVMVSMPGDDQDFFRPVYGKEIKINILTPEGEDFKFEHLSRADSRTFKVKRYLNGSLIFIGWMLPDQFVEPYIAPPYITTVSARCGLGELSNRIIGDTIMDVSGSESGWLSLFDFIASMINTIETDLNIWESINVFEAAHDTSISPLLQTYIYVDSYKDKTYYQALGDVLLTFGARIYQLDGAWNVVHNIEFADTLTRRRFDLTGALLDTDTTKSVEKLIGRPEGNQLANVDASRKINPAWHSVTFEHDLGLKEAFNLNHLFNDWEYVNSLGGKLNYWILSGKYGIDYSALFRDNEYILALNSTGDLTKNSLTTPDRPVTEMTKWVSQDIGDADIDTRLAIKLRYALELIYSEFDESEIFPINRSFAISIKLTGENGTYYIQDDGTWTTDIAGLYFTGVPLGTSFEEYSLITDKLPTSGTIQMRVYNPQKVFEDQIITRLHLREYSINAVSEKAEKFQETDLITTSINEDNAYRPNNIQVIGGDLPSIPSNNLIWKNGYYLDQQTPTAKWIGKTTELLLNGGFESWPGVDPDNWVGLGLTVTKVSISGSNWAQFPPANFNGSVFLYQDVSVISNQNYSLIFDMFLAEIGINPPQRDLYVSLILNDTYYFNGTEWTTTKSSYLYRQQTGFGGANIQVDLPPMPIDGTLRIGFNNAGTSAYRIDNVKFASDSDGIPLLRLTGQDYAQVYQYPQWMLEGSIFSENITFDSAIVDYLVKPTKYLCVSGQYDPRNSMFNGKFIEFGVWNGGNWILEDGTWNDGNIWIDGETWNDTDPTP